MAKSNGDGDSGNWWEEVCGIFTFLLSLLYAARNLLGGQPFFPRGRGVPGYPLAANNETWKDLGDALSVPSTSGDLRISPNIDPEGQYNVPTVDQPPAIPDPMPNIDADNVAAAEADLDMLLAVAEVASLPRQIERDEANMLVRRPQVLPSVAGSGVAPLSLVEDIAAGAPQHPPPQSPAPETVADDAPAPDVVGILAGVLPQQIEGEARAEAMVPCEAIPPGILEMITAHSTAPQFATPNMAVPGALESNLEERMPVNLPEAGDSSADLQAKINIQDDVENLEDEESHAEGMQ